MNCLFFIKLYSIVNPLIPTFIAISIGCGLALRSYLRAQLTSLSTPNKTSKRKRKQNNQKIAQYFVYAAIVVIFLVGNVAICSWMFITLIS